MNNRLDNRVSVFGRLGTFWHLNMDTRAGVGLARMLTRVSDLTGYKTKFENAERVLGGATETYTENESIPFKLTDVIVLDHDLQERVKTQWSESDGSNAAVIIRRPKTTLNLAYSQLMVELSDAGLTTQLGDFIMFPMSEDLEDAGVHVPLEGAKVSYVVPIEVGIKPLVIFSGNRELTIGTSFYAGDGFLVFFEPPSSLFKDGYIHTRTAIRSAPNLLNYTWQVDDFYGAGTHVANYYRARQTPDTLFLAMAEIAGLSIMPADGVLQRVVDSGVSRTYIFNTCSVTTNYEHTAIPVGTQVLKDTVIGDYIKLATNTSSSPHWYNNLEWYPGLLLDGLCPFKGLVIPDSICRFYGVGSSDDVHVRIDGLMGAADIKEKFWAEIRRYEQSSGLFLNAAVSLADESDEKYLNALQFYFEQMLGTRGLVIDLKTEMLGESTHRRVKDFIKREIPLGVVPIIRDMEYYQKMDTYLNDVEGSEIYNTAANKLDVNPNPVVTIAGKAIEL